MSFGSEYSKLHSKQGQKGDNSTDGTTGSKDKQDEKGSKSPSPNLSQSYTSKDENLLEQPNSTATAKQAALCRRSNQTICMGYII